MGTDLRKVPNHSHFIVLLHWERRSSTDGYRHRRRRMLVVDLSLLWVLAFVQAGNDSRRERGENMGMYGLRL